MDMCTEAVAAVQAGEGLEEPSRGQGVELAPWWGEVQPKNRRNT